MQYQYAPIKTSLAVTPPPPYLAQNYPSLTIQQQPPSQIYQNRPPSYIVNTPNIAQPVIYSPYAQQQPIYGAPAAGIGPANLANGSSVKFTYNKPI